MFSKAGHRVVGTDINTEIVEKLLSGKLTFSEKGLQELYDSALKNGIQFSTEYQKTDTYIIAVPTPYDKLTKKIDPNYVVTAFRKVLEVCLDNSIIIVESTVSPGTIDKYLKPIADEAKKMYDKTVHIVHAPERIIPGNMIYELENNNRVIGCYDYRIGQKVKELYASFCKGEIDITDIKTPEMVKVVENTFRDVNIAFANELAKICRKAGVDVYEVIRIANKHPRVNILMPGPGVGGHCIAVDPWFLVGDYPEETLLIHSARKVNESMPLYVLKRIVEIKKENNIKDFSRIGLYGLTYKENVDDTRESPTLRLLEIANEFGIEGFKVYDPYVTESMVENQYMDLEQFLNEVDIVVILVAHKHIKDNKHLLTSKVVYDTRHVFKAENGFQKYYTL